EELARVGGEAFHVAALALGVDRVEREARLSRAGQARDADQLLPREANGDVLQVVLPRPVDDELIGSHRVSLALRADANECSLWERISRWLGVCGRGRAPGAGVRRGADVRRG